MTNKPEKKSMTKKKKVKRHVYSLIQDGIEVVKVEASTAKEATDGDK